MEEINVRKPEIPDEGYIFRHKENTNDFSYMLYLGTGVSLDDYDKVPIAIYEEYLAEQERLAMEAFNEGGLM